MEIDRTKSKGKYDYKDQVKVLFSGPAKKFKKNNGNLMEGVEVVLQHDEKDGVVYLLVRLTATKNTIFTGYILEGKSTVRVLNNKEENLEISAFVISKGKKAELNGIKLQLDTSASGKDLLAKVQEAIDGKYKAVEQTLGSEKKQ
jgi:hypothetical protein